MALERIDVVVASFPEALATRSGRKALCIDPLGMDRQRNHLLVVGTVEDADPPSLRERFADAPQEVVIELLARGLPEGDDLNSLRVHAGHHVLDRRVLAGRIQRLEDDEERVGIARPQELLRVGELDDPLLQDVLRQPFELLLGELLEVLAPGPPGVALGEPGGRAGFDEESFQDLFTTGHRSSSPFLSFVPCPSPMRGFRTWDARKYDWGRAVVVTLNRGEPA